MEHKIYPKSRKVLLSQVEEVKPSGQFDSCVICLDTVSERATLSPCRHESFDFLCLLSWLQERSTCPLCKTEAKSVEYNRQSVEDFQIYKVTPTLHHTPAGTSATSAFPPTTSFRPRLQTSWQPRRPRRPLQFSPDNAILRRKQIYRLQLYSRHVGSNRISRYRELSPQLFDCDKELVSRARKWIRRELQAFSSLSSAYADDNKVSRRASNAEFLLEYIIAILKTVNLKSSGGQAEELLQEFLGKDDTRLFLHELGAWLRSPYSLLEDWDRNVQYGEDAIKLLKEKEHQSFSHTEDAESAQKHRPNRPQNSMQRIHENRYLLNGR